jgi:hypothetical protein
MGLEGVTVEFPETLYKGHFREDGYSGGAVLKDRAIFICCSLYCI